jgi:hypothetical protein
MLIITINAGSYEANTVKFRFIIFVGGSEKRTMHMGKRYMWGGLYKIGFVQGTQILNDESGKTIHPGTIERGFTERVYHGGLSAQAPNSAA